MYSITSIIIIIEYWWYLFLFFISFLGILPNGEFMYVMPDDPENYDFNHTIPF